MAPSEAPNRIRQWDVVVLPFPYSDRLAEKRRPALVISAERLYRDYGLVWVAMITSKRPRGLTCDVEISDLARAGLPASSVIRPAKIACIEPARIIRRAGHIEDTARDQVREVLSCFLGEPSVTV